MVNNPSILAASLMAGAGIENGFTKALRNTFTGGYYTLHPGHPNFNNELIKMMLEYKPTIIFIQIQTANILKPETAREIAKHSFVIQFSGDIRNDTESMYYDIGKEIQLTTFSNMRDVINCRKFGLRSEWLEIGYDPERFKSWENVKHAPEIVAHFNDYSHFPLSNYRRDIVEKLKNTFGSKFGVFGNFPGANGNFNDDQIAESKNYCGSKIAINCSNFFCERYSSDRILRAFGSGIMVLSHHFPDINKMYQVGKHLDTFNSLDELVRKCHYYLEFENKRESIAKEGQKHVLENYTFKKMAENILNLYIKNKK